MNILQGVIATFDTEDRGSKLIYLMQTDKLYETNFVECLLTYYIIHIITIYKIGIGFSVRLRWTRHSVAAIILANWEKSKQRKVKLNFGNYQLLEIWSNYYVCVYKQKFYNFQLRAKLKNKENYV